MERKRQGTLIYDEESGRYDIRFSLERYYGGLHCGECFLMSSSAADGCLPALKWMTAGIWSA